MSSLSGMETGSSTTTHMLIQQPLLAIPFSDAIEFVAQNPEDHKCQWADFAALSHTKVRCSTSLVNLLLPWIHELKNRFIFGPDFPIWKIHYRSLVLVGCFGRYEHGLECPGFPKGITIKNSMHNLEKMAKFQCNFAWCLPVTHLPFLGCFRHQNH